MTARQFSLSEFPVSSAAAADEVKEYLQKLNRAIKRGLPSSGNLYHLERAGPRLMGEIHEREVGEHFVNGKWRDMVDGEAMAKATFGPRFGAWTSASLADTRAVWSKFQGPLAAISCALLDEWAPVLAELAILRQSVDAKNQSDLAAAPDRAAAERQRNADAIEATRPYLRTELAHMVRECVMTHKPAIAEDFKQQVQAAFDRLVARYGAELKGASQSAMFVETIRPLLLKGQLDATRVNVAAGSYADTVADSVVAKLAQKGGNLSSPEVKYISWPDFRITGFLGDRQVSIHQSAILNVSKNGKLFNQFPARIRVDGESFSEEQYMELQRQFSLAAPADSAPVLPVASDTSASQSTSTTSTTITEAPMPAIPSAPASDGDSVEPILQQVLQAMSLAEDEGGPEGDRYVYLMLCIRAEAERRIAAFAERNHDVAIATSPVNRDELMRHLPIVVGSARENVEHIKDGIEHGTIPASFHDDLQRKIEAVEFMHRYYAGQLAREFTSPAPAAAAVQYLLYSTKSDEEYRYDTEWQTRSVLDEIDRPPGTYRAKTPEGEPIISAGEWLMMLKKLNHNSTIQPWDLPYEHFAVYLRQNESFEKRFVIDVGPVNALNWATFIKSAEDRFIEVPTDVRDQAAAILDGRIAMIAQSGLMDPAALDEEVKTPALDEEALASFMLNRIESGDLLLEDIPRRLARYGMMDPADFLAEMEERIQQSASGDMEP